MRLSDYIRRVYNTSVDFTKDYITVNQIRVIEDKILTKASQIGVNHKTSWFPGVNMYGLEKYASR